MTLIKSQIDFLIWNGSSIIHDSWIMIHDFVCAHLSDLHISMHVTSESFQDSWSGFRISLSLCDQDLWDRITMGEAPPISWRVRLLRHCEWGDIAKSWKVSFQCFSKYTFSCDYLFTSLTLTLHVFSKSRFKSFDVKKKLIVTTIRYFYFRKWNQCWLSPKASVIRIPVGFELEIPSNRHGLIN